MFICASCAHVALGQCQYHTLPVPFLFFFLTLPQVSYQQRLAIVPSALANGGKDFKVHVDPQRINSTPSASSSSAGSGHQGHRQHDAHNSSTGLHFAEVTGFDLLHPEVEAEVEAACSAELALLERRPHSTLAAGLTRATGAGTASSGIGRVSAALGPVVRVPVTVVLPEQPTNGHAGCTYKFTSATTTADVTSGATAGDNLTSPSDIAGLLTSPHGSPYVTPAKAAQQQQHHVSRPLTFTDGASAEAASTAPPAVTSSSPIVLRLRPGTLHRRFITVPIGATWAELSVHRVDTGGSASASATNIAAAPTKIGGVTPAGMQAAAVGSSTSAGTASDGYETEGEVSGIEAVAAQAASPLPGHHRLPPHHHPLASRPFSAPPAASYVTAMPVLPHPHPHRASSSIAVAAGSSSVVADASVRTIVVHALQVGRHLPPKARELSHERYMSLRPGEKDAIAFPVLPGHTLEADVGQFWSSLGSCEVTAEVTFRGITVDCGSELHVSGGLGCAVFTATPLLHDVTIKPAGRLNRHTTFLEPTSVQPVKLLSGRDTLVTGKRQYVLTASYKLSLSEAAKGVELSLGRVHDVLYESPWDSSHVSVTNEDGRVIATSEAFPESLSLPKGDVTITVSVRHDDISRLEGLRSSGAGLLLAVETPLDSKKSVKLTVTATHADAVVSGGGGGGGLGSRRCKTGAPLPLFLAAPSASSLPKGLKSGDILTGYLLLDDYAQSGLASSAAHGAGKDADGVSHVGRSPVGLKVVYHHQHATPAAAAPAATSSSGSNGSSAVAPPPSLQQRLADSVRDAAISALKELDPLAPRNGPPLEYKTAPADASAAAAGGGGGEVVSAPAPPAADATEAASSSSSSSSSSGFGRVPSFSALSASNATGAGGNDASASSGDVSGSSGGGELPTNEFDRLFHWLDGQHPNHLPLLQARLHCLDDAVVKKLWTAPPASALTPTATAAAAADNGSGGSAPTSAAAAGSGSADKGSGNGGGGSAATAARWLDRWRGALGAIVDAADDVIATIDKPSLAGYFGLRHDDVSAHPPGSEVARLHARMTSARAALLDALWRKARTHCVVTLALAKAGGAAGAVDVRWVAGEASSSSSSFDSSLSELLQWVQLSDSPPYALLAIERAVRRRQYAVALEAVNKAASGPRSELTKTLGSPQCAASLRVALTSLLGWGSPVTSRLVEHAVAALPTSWPRGQ